MSSAALTPTDSNLPRAIVCAVAAIGLFTTMGAMIKWLSASYPIIQILFARNAFSLVVLLPMIVAGGSAIWWTRRPFGHVLRFVFGIVSMCASFMALQRLPLPNHVAIGFAAPLFVTALAIPLLGEVVRWRRWAATIVGFVGVLVMVQPQALWGDGASADMPIDGALLGLTATFLYAVVIIVMRRLSSTESSATIVLWFSLGCTIATGVVVPFHWVTPATLLDAGLFVAIGMLGGVAQMLITDAYRWAPASLVSPLDYTGMLWATLLGFLVFDQLPSSPVLLGAAIVIASGLYTLHRERVLGLSRSRPAKPRVPTP